jgi:DNA repair exonuclease SbcCD ATPase subunit
MAMKSVSLSTKTPVASKKLSPEEFNTRLDQLAERCRSVGWKDLELRHEIGVLLIEAYGSPDVRQAYAEGVLKEASERLGMAKSDVSRMRRFAKRFKSLEDLKSQHPDKVNWTAVKKLLAELSAKDKEAKAAANGTQAPKSTKRKASPAKGLGKSLETLSNKLREAQKNLTELEKEDLIGKVQELVRSVSDCLGVKVSLNLDNAVASPPLDEPKAEAGKPAEANGEVQEVPTGTSQSEGDRGRSSAVN